MESEIKALKVFGARDLNCAETEGDGGEHLDVEEHEIALAEVFDEMVEGDFGGVADAVKHGFAGEEAANRDTVDAADKLVIQPAFEAVRVALLVKLGIGFEEFARNPGVAAARS